MGLYDRDYMREDEPGWRPAPRAPWSPTIALLALLGVVYVVQQALPARGSGWMERHFALSLDGICQWRLWQLVTFQFLHGGFFHVLLNGITLYSFGRFMEQELGRGRFLKLYFLSGIAGGVLQVTATWLLRQNPSASVVGASAGIAGLLGAFMLSYPDVRLVVFPLPFKVRAWTVLWIVLPLSVVGTVFPFYGIAHAAHLGGLLAGGAFIRWVWSSYRRHSPAQRSGLSQVRRVERAQKPEGPDFVADEVDPILEKIHAQGIHSLTERERIILAKARTRIGKR